MSLTPVPRTSARLTLARHDRYRRVTLASVALLAIAGSMAVAGLPPVDLHGPTHWFGVMDPFCGGTRAARYTALGEWDQAWRYNPLGILTVVSVGLIALRAAAGLLTRRWLTLDVQWSARGRRLAVGLIVVLAIALEVRQQGHAELLMEGTFTLV